MRLCKCDETIVETQENVHTLRPATSSRRARMTFSSLCHSSCCKSFCWRRSIYLSNWISATRSVRSPSHDIATSLPGRTCLRSAFSCFNLRISKSLSRSNDCNGATFAGACICIAFAIARKAGDSSREDFLLCFAPETFGRKCTICCPSDLSELSTDGRPWSSAMDQVHDSQFWPSGEVRVK